MSKRINMLPLVITLMACFGLLLSCDTTSPELKKNDVANIVLKVNNGDVYISLSGKNEITIEWGEGDIEKYFFDNQENKMKTFYRLNPDGESPTRTIAIKGDITRFVIRGNYLTELDVTNCHDLEYLDCFDNLLQSLNLSKNIRLTEVEISKNQFSSNELDNLFRTLHKNQIEKTIAFNENPGSSDCVISIAEEKGWNIPYPFEKVPNIIIALEPWGTHLTLGGIGGVTVDWGDGNSDYHEFVNDSLIKYNHPYSKISLSYIIKIFGTITYFSCGGPYITSLELKNSPQLKKIDFWYSKNINLDLSSNVLLEYLSFPNNSTYELNLSNNIMLNYLDCSIGKLTKLYLSNNTMLTYLDCGANDIFELDLSNNVELEYLACNANKIESLDLSHLPKLSSLICLSNPLRKLDVSKNQLLGYLVCCVNELSDLDVSKNTKLRYLDCCYNQLTELDVKNNSLLHSLKIDHNKLTDIDLTNNLSLEKLNCSANQLSVLDITKNQLLYGVECWGNYITELDVTNNPDLWLLYCSGNSFRKLDVSHNQKLSSLYITFNLFTAEEINEVFHTLHNQNNGSKKVYIGDNPGTDDCDTSIATQKGWRVIK